MELIASPCSCSWVKVLTSITWCPVCCRDMFHKDLSTATESAAILSTAREMMYFKRNKEKFNFRFTSPPTPESPSMYTVYTLQETALPCDGNLFLTFTAWNKVFIDKQNGAKFFAPLLKAKKQVLMLVSFSWNCYCCARLRPLNLFEKTYNHFRISLMRTKAWIKYTQWKYGQ